MKKRISILAIVILLSGIASTVYFIHNRNIEEDNTNEELSIDINDYIIRFVQDSKIVRGVEKEICIPHIKFLDENREELENRINETIYNTATDWMDYKFIKMNTKQIETELTCHNDKYISISLSYYLKANRSKILNNYIVVDITSGKRLFLKDFVSDENQLISKMKEGNGIYADTNAFALEKDEANNQLKSLLLEEPEEDLRQMLIQCSMEEKNSLLYMKLNKRCQRYLKKVVFISKGIAL